METINIAKSTLPPREVIEHYIDLHKMLHGQNARYTDIANDIVKSFDCDYEETLAEVTYVHVSGELVPAQYGLFIGRCQPFHLGHQAVINEIMLDGKIPIIMLGSSNKQDERNPLSFDERKKLIEMIYPNKEIRIIALDDFDDWDEWMEEVMIKISDISYRKENVTLYYHNKEVDRQHFIYKGLGYHGFYTKVFEIENIKTKEIEFVDRHDFKIDSNARDIRHDLEGYKHFIDARIYWELRRKGWE